MREILSLIGSVFLGLVLIVATVGKMLDPIVFLEQIRNEGLEIVFSAGVVALIALALEMGFGVLLLMGVRSLWVLVPTGLLVVFFLFLTARSYYRVLTGRMDDAAGCGCFGVFLERTASQAFWQDLLLLLPALLFAFLSRRALLSRIDSWKIAVSLIATAAVVGHTIFIGGIPLTSPTDDRERAAVEENVYSVYPGFQLFVDGEADRGGRVYQSADSMEFLILASHSREPLMIELLKNSVARLPETSIELVDGQRVKLDRKLGANLIGKFEIGPQGPRFQAGDRIIELRSP